LRLWRLNNLSEARPAFVETFPWLHIIINEKSLSNGTGSLNAALYLYNKRSQLKKKEKKRKAYRKRKKNTVRELSTANIILHFECYFVLKQCRWE